MENENIYLAMECMVCDLAKLVDDEKVVFSEDDIADLFKQILLGVNHLHKNWILHRVGLADTGLEASKYSGGQVRELQGH